MLRLKSVSFGDYIRASRMHNGSSYTEAEGKDDRPSETWVDSVQDVKWWCDWNKWSKNIEVTPF